MAKSRTGRGRTGAGGRPADSGGPVGTIDLCFQRPADLAHVEDPLVRDLSAVAVAGATLFCAADEAATLERLQPDADGRRLTRHVNFPLGRIFELPGGPDGEMDIEGLAVDDGWLWVTGSHSLKRDAPDSAPARAEALDDIDWDENRGFLGRLPLLDRGAGLFEPVARIETLDGRERRAACLPMDSDGGNAVRELLAEDPLLGPYTKLPCKENGLDVEGLAVSGSRVFLGLRGPVLGGYALLVELSLKEGKKGLKPRRLDGKRRYRLHAVDLGGLGIRDLLVDRGRLLILAGVTMDLDGPQAVFALDPLPGPGEPLSSVAPRRLLELPQRAGVDHAEGIERLELPAGPRLIVIYDSPAPERLSARDQRLRADLFEMV